MHEQPLISEVPEDDSGAMDVPKKTDDAQLLGNFLTTTNSSLFPTTTQGIPEIQSNLVAVDQSERVSKADTNLLNATGFVPPQTFWEDFQRAPESPGFWSTVRDLPQEVLISVGVAFLAFLSYLAFQLRSDFVWIILGCGAIVVLYVGLEKLSRAHEVSAASHIRDGQVSLIATLSSGKQQTAVQFKQQSNQMLAATLAVVKDVENIRADIAKVEIDSRHRIAIVHADKDIKIKEIDETSATERTKIQNDKAIKVAEIEANTTEQIEKGKQAIEQQRITSQEKIDETKLKNEKDKHLSEQQTKVRIAEWDKNNEKIQIELQAEVKSKEIEAETTKHELRQRNETEQKKMEMEAAANKVREEYAHKTRKEEETTKRIQNLSSYVDICFKLETGSPGPGTRGSFYYSWGKGKTNK